MNCDEAQQYLSDFLDKSLDNERAGAIEDHLAACSGCSEELASLAECQRLVSGLSGVEAPVGFTNRVMARVREAAHPPSLWERLFSPLRIKIPLQATAVVLIAVLAAYIYQREPLQRESAVAIQPESSFREHETDRLAPSLAQAPIADSKTKQVAEETKARVQEFKDSIQLKGLQSRRKPEEQDNAPGIARPQDQDRSPATPSPAPFQEKSSAANEVASPRQEQSSSSREAQSKEALAPTPPEKQILSKDTVSAAKSSFSPEARERSAASSLDPIRSGTVVGVAVPTDHELAIRLKEPVRADKATGDRSASSAQAERRSSISQEETKNLDQARERAIQRGQSQTVWLTIARNQYEPFKKELADLGNIEVESSTPERKNNAVAKSPERLRIKITLLPPLPSGNPVPSQPSSR